MRIEKAAFGFILILAAITSTLLVLLGVFASATSGRSKVEPVPNAVLSRNVAFTYTSHLPFVDTGPVKVYLPIIANKYPPPDTVFGVELDGGLPQIAAIGSMWAHKEAILSAILNMDRAVNRVRVQAG